MATKRGRPISALTDDPVLDERRARNRQYRRAFDARKRAQRPDQRPPTTAQLQQGQNIIQFPFNDNEIPSTIDGLGLRVQGLTIAQDIEDARAQRNAVPVDEHDRLYDDEVPPPAVPAPLIPAPFAPLSPKSMPPIPPPIPPKSSTPPLPVADNSTRTGQPPLLGAQSDPWNASGQRTQLQPHPVHGSLSTRQTTLPFQSQGSSSSKSQGSSIVGPSNATRKKPRARTSGPRQPSSSSSNSITRFIERRVGVNPFEASSPSLPPLPPNTRLTNPRGLDNVAPRISSTSLESEISRESHHTPESEPSSPESLPEHGSDIFDQQVRYELDEFELDNHYDELNPFNNDDNFNPPNNEDDFNPLNNDDDDNNNYPSADPSDSDHDRSDKHSSPNRSPTVEDAEDDNDETLDREPSLPHPARNPGPANQHPPIPEGIDDEDGVEESGGEFQEEHEVDREKAAAVAEIAQRLVDQLQGGFNGCPADAHATALRKHMRRFERSRLTHHGLDAISPSARSFPRVLSQRDILKPQQLANTTTPTPQQWNTRFCGVVREQNTPGNRQRRKPQRVCLHTEGTREIAPGVAPDTDSFMGFASSTAVARQGLYHQPTAQVKQNMQTDTHITTTTFFQPEGRQEGDPDADGSEQEQNSGEEEGTPEDNAAEDDAAEDNAAVHNTAEGDPPIGKPVMLKNVPHFLLGTVVGAGHVSMYILFPHLPFQGNRFIAMTNHQLSEWNDKVFHTAVYRHCPAHVSQHLTASYRSALAQAKAHQVEARRAETSSYQSQQSIKYLIQPEYLVDIWASILELVTQPGLQQYREPQLFFCAKGTKLQFKASPSAPTLLDVMERFETYLQQTLDMEFVYLDRLFVDIGKEICPEVSILPSMQRGQEEEPQVYLWRRCCLQHYINAFHHGKAPSDKGHGQRYYTQNMLYDACSLTSLAPKRSKAYLAGLRYSQFYNSVKEAWDATTLMPFDNEGIEELALDPLTLKTIKTNAGGRLGSTRVLRKAYCAAKQRTHFALTDNIQKSYGIREEHRISWELFQAILAILRAHELEHGRENLEIFMDDAPSYVWAIRTSTYFDFIWRSVDKFASGFEYVHAQTNRRMVTWEQTKMMAMFLRCLRYVLGGQGLSRESSLWWSRHEGDPEPNDEDSDVNAADRAPARRRRRTWIGLGFKNTISRYGYAWLEPRFDWDNLQFSQDITRLVLFGNSFMRNRYLQRGGRVQDFIDASHVLEKGLQWLARFRDAQHEEITRKIIRWIVHLIMRQFRIDVITTFPPAELRAGTLDEARKGQHAFTYSYIQSIMRAPPYLIWSNTTRFKQPSDLWKYLFKFNDGVQRKSWDALSFRTMFQRTCESMMVTHGPEHPYGHRFFRDLFYQQFAVYHWILPVPHPLGLLQLSKKTATKPAQRMLYSSGPILLAADNNQIRFRHHASQWQWMQTLYHDGPALEFPREANWTDVEMQAWIEQATGLRL